MQINHDCPYCGQSQLLILGGALEDFKPYELDKIAALECDCLEAKAFQGNEEMKTQAEAAVKELFKNDSADLQNFLIDSIPHLANLTLSKVSASSDDGIKAVLTRRETRIRVERIITEKRVKE